MHRSASSNSHFHKFPMRVLNVLIEFLSECAKVVFANDCLRGNFHRLHVDCTSIVVHVSVHEWIAWSDANPISVMPVIRAEPTVEIFANLCRRNNRHVRLEITVKNSNVLLSFHIHGSIEVTNLPQRMCTAIRAARADDLHILAGCPANSLCQSALDSSLPSLRGPAAKIGAVVRDDELYSLSRQARERPSRRRRLGACRFASIACIRQVDPCIAVRPRRIDASQDPRH